MDTGTFRRLRAEGKLPFVPHPDKGAGKNGPDMAATSTRYLMDVEAASKWLSIPRFTLYSWAQTGKIPCIKLGRRVLFCKDDLAGWISDHRREAREG